MRVGRLHHDDNAKQRTLFTALLAMMIFIEGIGLGPAENDLRYWYSVSRYTFWMEIGFVALYLLIRSPRALFLRYWRRHRRVVLVSILWFLTVLLAYLLSDFYAPGNPLATMRLKETVGHFLFFVTLYDALSHYRIDGRLLIISLIASTLFVAFYFIAVLLVSGFSDTGWLPEFPVAGHWAINGNIRRVGYQLEAAVLAAIPFLFEKGKRLLAGVIILAMLWLIFWLGGRASVLGVLAGILSLGFFLGWRRSFLLAGIYLGLFVSIGFIDLEISTVNTNYTPTKIQQTLHARSIHQFSSGRDDVWRLELRKLKKSPLIGNGPQSYFFYPGHPPSVIHAHNFLLQFLGEWGVLGAGLFLYLLCLAFKQGFKNLTKETRNHSLTPERLAGWAMITGLTTTAFFGGIYFFTQSCFFLAVAYALCSAPEGPKSP